ncbi:MAG: YicC/YloC family endoribonuclease, partial [Oscillospiraceae bacterium]
MSRFFSFLDDKVKSQVNEGISRGKVEVSLLVKGVEKSDLVIEADLPLARSYYEALQSISKTLCLNPPIDAVTISRYDGVLTQAKSEEDAERIWWDVSSVLS